MYSLRLDCMNALSTQYVFMHISVEGCLKSTHELILNSPLPLTEI